MIAAPPTGIAPISSHSSLNARAALAADGAGEAASELQIIVGGVHDGVHIHFRDVALADFDSLAEFHSRSSLLMAGKVVLST